MNYYQQHLYEIAKDQFQPVNAAVMYCACGFFESADTREIMRHRNECDLMNPQFYYEDISVYGYDVYRDDEMETEIREEKQQPQMSAYRQLKKDIAQLARDLGLSKIYKSTGKIPELKRKYSELQNIQFSREFGQLDSADFIVSRKQAIQKNRLISENIVKTLPLKGREYEDDFQGKTIAQRLTDHIKKLNIPSGAVVVINGQIVKFNKTSQIVSDIINVLPYADRRGQNKMLREMWWTKQRVTQRAVKQAYRFGDIINCFIGPVINLVQQRIECAQSKETVRKYKRIVNAVKNMIPDFEREGATKDLIQKLCNTASLSAKIFNPITMSLYEKYKSQNHAKCQFKIKYVNTRFNHVDQWISDKQEIRVISDTEDYTAVQAMNEIAHEVLSTDTYIFKKNGDDDVIEIKYADQHYIREDYYRLKEACADMQNEISDLKLRLNKRQIDLANQFMTCHQNQRLIQESDTKRDIMRHIDTSKSYAVGPRLGEHYSGFVYAQQLRYCDNQTALQYNGLYVLDINEQTMPRYMKLVLQRQFLQKYYYLSHPIIKLLHSEKVEFNVIGGFYGNRSKYLQYTDNWLRKHYDNKGAYFIVPCNAMREDGDAIRQMVHIANEEIAQLTANEKTHIYRKNADENIYIIEQEREPREYHNTLKLYSAQILQYQTLAILLQLREMDSDKIIAMVGDDIYYHDHDFKMMPYMSADKNNDAFDKIDWNKAGYYYYNAHRADEELIDLSKMLGQKRAYGQYELHLGPGGHGKSYQALMDIGNISVVYTTLTNDLVRKQKEQYNCKAYTSARMTTELQTKMKFQPGVIVADEIGLMGDHECQQLRALYPNSIIYFLGDDLQLRGRNECDEIFDENNYDVVYSEDQYKTDYRAKCPVLRELKQRVRQAMRAGKTEYELYYIVYNYIRKQQRVQKSEVERLYDSATDIIVTETNNAKNNWNQLLVDKKPKYRVSKTFIKNGVTYCTGEILTDIPFESKNFVVQHAYTCHSLQGQTHRGKLFISRPIRETEENKEMASIFRGYVYTAISRCVNIEQIYCVQ